MTVVGCLVTGDAGANGPRNLGHTLNDPIFGAAIGSKSAILFSQYPVTQRTCNLHISSLRGEESYHIWHVPRYNIIM